MQFLTFVNLFLRLIFVFILFEVVLDVQRLVQSLTCTVGATGGARARGAAAAGERRRTRLIGGRSQS